MTQLERILAVFRGEQPDVMPWFADLTYWYAAQEAWGRLPEGWQGDGVVRMYRDLNVGCHEHALNSPWRTAYEGVEVETRYEGEGEARREITTWTTPVGTLTQVKQFEPRSHTWAYRKYPVATPQDLRALRFIFEHQQVTPDYATQERQLELWGEQAVCASMPIRTPLANLIVIWMGVTNAVYALADCPEEMEATTAAQAAGDDPIYDIICRSPAPLVYIPDNITGEVVGPFFERYYAPYYRRRNEQLHAAGKYTFVHIDGTMRGVLEWVGATGTDCAQSLTPAPVGDVAVSEMRELAGPELILWGGVPAAYFSPIYPEQAVRDIVLECIEHHLAYGRFMLCVCDQVPPDGIIERVRLVSELVEEYGRYD